MEDLLYIVVGLIICWFAERCNKPHKSNEEGDKEDYPKQSK